MYALLLMAEKWLNGVGPVFRNALQGISHHRWLRLSLLLLLLLLILALPHLEVYFHNTYYEWGDFAANGLQIEKAKRFQEILGHYSRFQIHHPGPTYFYLYALGEFLFLDLFHLVPTPFNAYLLTGLIIQVAFFLAALTIMARQVQLMAFLPLALGLASLHFSLAGNAFYSIWPPHTLLFPMLAFLVGCAALASGNVDSLPLVIISGGFLVHGYVPLPLFVVPLFLLAYLLFVQQTSNVADTPRLMRGLRTYPDQHFWAMALLAVFLLPLFLDALRGAESNLYAIFQFLGHRNEDPDTGKTLQQSVLYILSYLTYLKDPKQVTANANVALIVERSRYLWAWAAIYVLPLFIWRRKVFSEPTKRFGYVRRTYLFFLGALPLMVLWGLLQTGQMHQQNAYFFFAILFLPGMILATALAHLVQQRVGTVRLALLYVAAIAAIFVGFRNRFPGLQSWDGQVLQQALLSDPSDAPIKYLTFPRQEWPLALGVALGLERAGYQFRVAPGWGFMFGRNNVLENSSVLADGSLSVWRFVPLAAKEADVQLSQEIALHFVLADKAVVEPEQTKISFGHGGSAYLYETFGWGATESNWTWSVARVATLDFIAEPAGGDVRVVVEGFPFQAEGQLSQQRMHIRYNGIPVHEVLLTKASTVDFVISKELWNAGSQGALSFEFPDAVTPRSLDLNMNQAILGFAFVEMRIREVDDASPSQAPFNTGVGAHPVRISSRLMYNGPTSQRYRGIWNAWYRLTSRRRSLRNGGRHLGRIERRPGRARDLHHALSPLLLPRG